MYHHNASNICGHEVNSGAAEANRLPQFNESYCGYRCGWGCCEPLNGEGTESNATPTLVGSEDEHRTTGVSVMPQVEIESPPRTGLPSHESIQASGVGDGRSMSHGQDSYSSSQLSQYYDRSQESLGIASSSGSRGAVALNSGNAGTMSPRVWLVGAGMWDVNNEADRFPPHYHFLATPLRLSPQYEHCRGHQVSHMVIQDDLVLLDYVEEDWRRRALGVERFLWHGERFPSR